MAFALFAYGFFGFAGDFVGAKSSVSAYGENAGDVTIEKLGHEPGEWIVDREPTAEETGHRYKECIRCNEVIEEEILEKLPPEDNGMDKGEGDKDDGTDDGKNDDGGKNDGSSGGNNGDAGNVGGEPQPTQDNDKSESESGKNDVSPSLAILLPISALIVLPFIIAAVKSIRKNGESVSVATQLILPPPTAKIVIMPKYSLEKNNTNPDFVSVFVFFSLGGALVT